MKTINTYINEKLQLTSKRTYTCQPKDKKELREIILQRIKDEGPNCDLNDIDTSKITDMSYLFNVDMHNIFKNFNGNISEWDVSNVTGMSEMFFRCKKFNCDISRWNVSKVKNMNSMFLGCFDFEGDISSWNVSNVCDMGAMFYGCRQFDCNLSSWDVSKVEIISHMFCECKRFNQDLNSWDVSQIKNMNYAFWGCPTQPTWYDKKRWE